MQVLLISFLSIAIHSGNWFTNFDEAKAIAAKENKYILLNFSGSDWCAPCIKMKSEVFESQTFISIAEKQLILVRADFPRSKKNQLTKEQVKRNEALAEKYNPEGKFPLTLLLESNGKIIKEWDGYVYASQDRFMADLNNAMLTK